MSIAPATAGHADSQQHQPPPPAIRFANVSKRFQINKAQSRTIGDFFLRIFGRRREREYFWPLQDVTFEVPRGVSVGLIGENGAGKSTMLKLITRILQPTEGSVEVGGRVSALLELGAGFHPELTGRENIDLHCSLLGMKQEEIEAIVQPVIDFADLGAFMDTPVKHYSSGMHARLGFAIAVHVQPEILLVDEVLAVGDEAFQRRCLDTIDMLRSRGVTIVLVSHSLSHILKFCDQCIWLDEGRVRMSGVCDGVVRAYLNAVDDETAQRLIAENALHDWANERGDESMPLRPPRRWGKGPISIEQVEMVDEQGTTTWSFNPLDAVTVRIRYRTVAAVENPVFSVLIHKMDGHYLWASNTEDHPVASIESAGEGVLLVNVDALALTAGRYRLSAAAYPAPDAPYWRSPSDYHEQVYEFQITSEREIHGDIVMPSSWTHLAPAVTDATDTAAASTLAGRRT